MGRFRRLRRNTLCGLRETKVRVDIAGEIKTKTEKARDIRKEINDNGRMRLFYLQSNYKRPLCTCNNIYIIDVHWMPKKKKKKNPSRLEKFN